MRVLLALSIALALAVPATAAQADPPMKRWTARQLDRELQDRAIRVAEARQAAWGCQTDLGVPLTRAEAKVWAMPRSPGYRAWAARLWRARTVFCEQERERRTLPALRDWVSAVRVAQRVYPGTESWLLSCSAAESSHGRWVYYGGDGWEGGPRGDTVGGWMQFRPSTFYAYWPSALADTRRRGFIVPGMSGYYGPWASPLGQALTAGYMRYNGLDGYHWSASHGSGC